MKWQQQQDDKIPYTPKFYKRDPDNDETLSLEELLGSTANYSLNGTMPPIYEEEDQF